MCALIRVLTAVVALAMSTGSALAAMGKTTTDVALRRAPSAQAELILNLSRGTLVNVDGCSRGWCGVTWNRYVCYVRQSALRFLGTPASGPPVIPVFPPYPYKAGHYSTADAYYDLPPYAAIDPSFYRWRHFLTAQERNRYRYMPYIFHGAPSAYREQPTFKSAETTAPAIEPVSPKPKMEPSPATPGPSTQAPPPAVTPAPTPQAPEVSPPAAAPAPSPETPEVSPPSAAPAPTPQAPEVSPPTAEPTPSPQPAERPLGATETELADVTKGWSVKRSILGQTVYNEKDERVGSVDDIIIKIGRAHV